MRSAPRHELANVKLSRLPPPRVWIAPKSIARPAASRPGAEP